MTLESFAHSTMAVSSPEYLAQMYTGASVQEFAAQLEPGSVVIDIGAGLSRLGHAVVEACSTQNKHIRWINVDPQYDDPASPQAEQVREFITDAPQGLEFIQASVLELPEEIRGIADHVFSYNVLPHLERIGRAQTPAQFLGRQALQNMLDLAKPTGTIGVGPTSAEIRGAARWNVARLPANASATEIEKVAASLQSPPFATAWYDAGYSSGVSMYNRGRFSGDPADKHLIISADGGQSYYEIYTPRGVAMASRLAIGLAAQIPHFIKAEVRLVRDRQAQGKAS